MKIKNIYFLYVISFFFLIIFNSPKCYEYERFESIDAMEKYLKILQIILMILKLLSQIIMSIFIL